LGLSGPDVWVDQVSPRDVGRCRVNLQSDAAVIVKLYASRR